MDTEGKKIHFHQGRKAGEYTNEEECLKSIKQKLAWFRRQLWCNSGHEGVAKNHRAKNKISPRRY